MSITTIELLLYGILGWMVVIAGIDLVKALASAEQYKKKVRELQESRIQDRAALHARTDLSEEEKSRFETKIDQSFARVLDDLDERSSRSGRILRWLAALGGMVGVIAGVRYSLQQVLGRRLSFEFFTTTAWAAEGIKTELSPFIPYVAMGVLLLMAMAFLVALATILIVKDVKENQARIKAADNIVKTFGGFFTGLATTLLH